MKKEAFEILNYNGLVEITDDKVKKEVLKLLEKLPFKEEAERVKEGIEFATEFILRNEFNLRESVSELMKGWDHSSGKRARRQELLYRGLMCLFGSHFLIPARKSSLPLYEYNWRLKYRYRSAFDGIAEKAKKGGREAPLVFHLAYLSWVSYLLSRGNAMKKLWDALSEKGREELLSIPEVLEERDLPHHLYFPAGYLKKIEDKTIDLNDPIDASLRGMAYPVLNYVFGYIEKVYVDAQINVKFEPYAIVSGEYYTSDFDDENVAMGASSRVNEFFLGAIEKGYRSFAFRALPLVLCVERQNNLYEGFLYLVSSFVAGIPAAVKHLEKFGDGWRKHMHLSTLSRYVKGIPHSTGFVLGDWRIDLASPGDILSSEPIWIEGLARDAGRRLVESILRFINRPGKDVDYVRAIELGNTVFLTKFIAERLSAEHLLNGVRFKFPAGFEKYYTNEFFNDFGDLILVEEEKEW